MTTFLVLSFLALVIYGLERNHRRQLPRPAGLAGSGTAEDRDAARVHADVVAATRHHRAAHHARPWSTARLQTRTP